jgi:transposase
VLAALVTEVGRRQVFDVPEVKVVVTGRQLIERECGCGHRTKGAAPQGAETPVQYGPRVAAVIVYLYIGPFLSTQRTAQALAELSGIALSPGKGGRHHRPRGRAADPTWPTGNGQPSAGGPATLS